ncbi:carbon-nitrogen family hydrolase [Bacillus gobiensis]|uniref:Hydrolase n=1 Tax=Bacillus gobiensis TaxID=1441095 RepID=A0A0M4FYB0_9BACI|nr:carbon-nitrogen family hydrolase [Bacillus gobiensis]ALC84093.1 hydrolase [Bacillus gobiensis]
MKLKIACLQFDISFGNPAENYQKAERFIKKASDADVVILPELWTTGYDLSRLDEIGDENGKYTKQWLSDIARTYEVNIVAGSVAVKKNDGIYNTMYIVGKNGDMLSEYSKVHLFKLMDEHHYLAAGSKENTFALEGIQACGVICYDIRFPEWIRKHTENGASLLFVSAEWPAPRLDHWKALLIARAIENQCFVAACNCSGSNPDNQFAGHSMIIDPWGKIIAEASDGEEIISAELELGISEKIRAQIPIFSDRRTELY